MLAKLLSWLRSTPENEFNRLYERFAASRAGASSKELGDELAIRTSFLRVKRIVSAKVLKHPQLYDGYFAAAVKAEGLILQAIEKRLGFAWYRVMKATGADEILTREAFQAYVKHGRQEPFAPSPDTLAALRRPLEFP